MLRRLFAVVLGAGFCFAQNSDRKPITVSPEVLRNYVGVYQMTPGVNFMITLSDSQLVSQMTGQSKVPLLAESETTFYPKGINATIDFPKDGNGPAQQLALHQNGRDITARRLGDVQAGKIIAAQEATDKRFKDQTPASGGEAAVRRMIVEIESGKPNYDLMSQRLGDATRRQLSMMQSRFSELGAIQSVIFKGVGPGGADIYQCNFEKGSINYRIWLGEGGRVESANFRPTEYPIPSTATAESLRPRLTEIEIIMSAELAKRSVGSVTAGVIARKELVWTKSYGDADMEKKTPANADTVYRIGSITKMFTALMLEQLADAGKVHLSDPAEKYLPEVRSVQGRFPDAPPITLIQLATHTSGLDREPGDTETYLKGPMAQWDKILIAAIPHTRYLYEPGTRFSYSNIGFAILGAALSRAAGESYVQYMERHVFQPLGMTHSAFERNDAMMPHLAKGYQMTGPGAKDIDSETPEREHETGRGYKVPNGAIYTTVGDLARFASFLMEQGPESVLKTESLNRFQIMVPANIDLNSGYGMGFQVDRRDGYVAMGHGGAVAGYTAMLLLNRAKSIGVIVFSNGSVNPGQVAEKALDILSK